MVCENIEIREVIIDGKQSERRLFFAGQDTVELAAKYGTPLYLMDEDRIRRNCRVYKDAFEKHFGPGSYPLYASKAGSFIRLYEIMSEENMGIDLVSSGELYTALQAGYDVSRAYFHGNNKTDFDIRFGIESGVGYFVADNAEEVLAIEREAAEYEGRLADEGAEPDAEFENKEDATGCKSFKQKVLLRITPGIDPHTLEAVATGKVDSKFGNAIVTGQAEEITLLALDQPHIELMGFHCHIGSQIFTEDVFEQAAEIMLEFIAHIENAHGFKTRELNLGGGYGVRYVEDDPYLDVNEKIGEVAEVIDTTCQRLGIDRPAIHMEPGRSIVADAGMTLYTVGGVKRIPGYKNYVSVDGGMADNPRYALYGSKYTCLLAGKGGNATDAVSGANAADVASDSNSGDAASDTNGANTEETFVCSVVGRCCESGDIIQENVELPANVERGDILAVCTTGAYNYSMASNYNRLPRPPIVMLRGGNEDYVAVRRESLEDIVRNDVRNKA